MKYELTVDAKENWAICEEGASDVIADFMTKEVAQKLCDLLNNEHARRKKKGQVVCKATV